MVPECPTLLLGRDLSLPLKYCNYCSPDRRCFKTLSWRQTNYFYQSPSETTPEWERPIMVVWSKNPKISSSVDGKFRHGCIPLWGSLSNHPPDYTQGLSPLSLLPRNLGPLDKSPRGVVRRLSNPEEIWYTDWSSSVLDGKRTGYAVVSNFATIETKPFPPGTSTQLAELIALNSSFRAGKRKKSSHLHWL